MVKMSSEAKLVNIDQITPYHANIKKHPQHQIDKLASMIAEYGWDQPIVVDAKMVVIKGHGRLLAAQKLGLDQVPVIVRDDLNPAQVKAARIADNKIAESEWDLDNLKLEFDELNELNFNIDMTGFSEIEILKIIDPASAVGKNDAEKEWVGMPDYEDPEPCYKKIIVNFDTKDDVDNFFQLIDQSYTDKTKSIWFPKKERRDLDSMRWTDEKED